MHTVKGVVYDLEKNLGMHEPIDLKENGQPMAAAGKALKYLVKKKADGTIVAGAAAWDPAVTGRAWVDLDAAAAANLTNGRTATGWLLVKDAAVNVAVPAAKVELNVKGDAPAFA